MRITCVHLLDDFSGSAKVFAHAIEELKSTGAEVRVTVGSAGDSGFIRRAHPAQTVFYRFRENKLLLLFFFALAQLLLFFAVLRHCLLWRADVVYANTVLAPGAVLAGRLCRRRVVVHIHEVGLGTKALFRTLLSVARGCADTLVCVSGYVRTTLALPRERAPVVYNSLSPAEWQRASGIARARHDVALSQARPEGATEFVVLMACSLKWYKGIDSFLELARELAARGDAGRRISFRLLLNCTPEEWRAFARNSIVAANVRIEFRPPDVYHHYAEASLVLNLSHPDGWIETFGMTLLEAMACGVPVIAPRVGGCVEIFEHGNGGWQIESRDIAALQGLIIELAADDVRWRTASGEASLHAQRFDAARFARELRAAVLG
jgi:glycosyltransferase involved in cell wall biosynthesis